MNTERATTSFLLICLSAGCASLLFGGSVAATRYVVHETDPVTLAFLRFVLSSLCLAPFVLLGRRVRIQTPDLVRIALLGCVVYVGFPLMFNAGLQYVTAARGAVILSTVPLFTLAVARLLGHEVLTSLKLGGGALAVIGTVIALGDKAELGVDIEKVWIGDLCMFGAVIAGAIYNVLARPYLHRYPVEQVTLIGMATGTVVLFVLAVTTQDLLLTGLPEISTGGWISIAFLGTLGSALAFYLWHWALERTTPSRVAVFGSLNPLAAMLLGLFILSEPITPPFLVGLIFVIGGIFVVNYVPKSKQPAQPAE